MDSAESRAASPLEIRQKPSPLRSPGALRAGIGIGIFLGAFDGAVIATLLPSMASDLGGAGYLTWLAGGYALGTAIAAPAWGIFGDARGHHVTVSIGLWLLLASTALCAMVGVFQDASFPVQAALQLSVIRFVQGAASAAIFTGGIAMFADFSPIRERARTAGGFSLMFAIATGFAPAIGGLVSGRMAIEALGVTIAGWRLVFALQLPLALVALWLMGRPCPRPTTSVGSFDFVGLALIALAVFASTIFIHALGDAWMVGKVLAVAALAVALTGLWVVEHRVARPILSPQLLAIDTVRRSCAIGTLTSAALLAFAMCVPLNLQVMLRQTPEATGAVMVAFSVGIAAGAFIGGHVLGHTGRLRDVTLAAIASILLGLALMAAVPGGAGLWLFLAVFGIGLGFGPLQILNGLFSQHIAPAGRQGATSGLLQFFRRLGAAIGAASSGLLFLQTGSGIAGVAASGDAFTARLFFDHFPHAAPAALCGIFLIGSLLIAHGLPRERLR